MTPEQTIADIESCSSLDELKILMQRVAENYGFASFNFLDVGNPHVDVPFYMGTTGVAWESDYKSNGFVHVDQCVKLARRSNLPFSWDKAPPPPSETGPKKGIRRLVEAATDHGFKNGLVVPFHYRDSLGRHYSSLCVFYWKDTISRFNFLIKHKKFDLQIVVIYWVQKAVDIVADDRRIAAGNQLAAPATKISEVALTDREREVLAWAARGKTTDETAEILTISHETVQTHVNRAMRKLGATNKTHAAVQAVFLGLIDY